MANASARLMFVACMFPWTDSFSLSCVFAFPDVVYFLEKCSIMIHHE